MSSEVMKISKKAMHDPLKILLNEKDLFLEGIKHFNIKLEKEEDKLGKLIEIYDCCSITQTMVFTGYFYYSSYYKY